jgi:CMP-N-acetylneuraminic acid synthetase
VRTLGLIPARGGSKGIPAKNLVDLAGKPLLAWSIEAANASTCLATVVVSTDDRAVAETAAGLGATVLDRPAALAADDSPMIDVVLHAVEALPGHDAICLLQPTSPLRRSTHVDDAVELLERSGADGVVSVVEVPHQYVPGSLLTLVGERLVPLDPDGPTLRQDKPVLYARNGPAVLVVRAEGLAARGLYGGVLLPYAMDARHSVDVDGPFELELARLLIS